jgi:hypothetical protein
VYYRKQLYELALAASTAGLVQNAVVLPASPLSGAMLCCRSSAHSSCATTASTAAATDAIVHHGGLSLNALHLSLVVLKCQNGAVCCCLSAA